MRSISGTVRTTTTRDSNSKPLISVVYQLYPIIFFDLRENKKNLTNETKQLVYHYRLIEAANAQDYTIFAAVLYEEEIVLDTVGGELVVA